MKKSIKILLILAIIIILAVLAFIFYPSQPVNDNQNGNGDVVENGEVDTSDWGTYQNEELGFGFKYSNIWSKPRVESNPDMNYAIFISITKKDREIDGYGSIQGSYDSNFISTGSLHGNIEFVSNKYKYIFDDLGLKEFDIKNGKAYCSVDKDKLYGMNLFCKLISAKHFISLEYKKFDEDLESSEKAFKEIISTFEFYE